MTSAERILPGQTVSRFFRERSGFSGERKRVGFGSEGYGFLSADLGDEGAVGSEGGRSFGRGQAGNSEMGYREGTLWACPENRERLPCHDHVERRWRHLDTCGFETILEARVPRVRGSDGKVWTVPVPWAEKGSRFTLMFEGFVVRVLLACRSLSAASDLLGLSWDQLHRIMERAVERGLE